MNSLATNRKNHTSSSKYQLYIGIFQSVWYGFLKIPCTELYHGMHAETGIPSEGTVSISPPSNIGKISKFHIITFRVTQQEKWLSFLNTFKIC